MDNGQPKLTKRESEILTLITEHYLTPAQLSARLKISKNRVYVHIRNLRKKGALTKTNTKNRWYSNGSVSYGDFRLHGQQYKAQLLYVSPYYRELREKSNIIMVDNNTVKLHRDSINIYIGQSFLSDTVEGAVSQSLEYLARFLVRLEYELKVRIVKSRKTNIKQVAQHIAKTQDELSSEIQSKGDSLKIYSSEDGKLWLTADNSLNLKELETLHSETSERDMSEVVIPFFNDLRDNGVFLPSEIKDSIEDIKLYTAFGSRVKYIFSKIKTPQDIFKFKEEIEGLSESEKLEFTEELEKLTERGLYGGY